MDTAKSQPEIVVYTGFEGSNSYTWSPFVTKLEARLRFAGIKYRTASGSPRSAPRGKIPYVSIKQHDTDEATLLGDSTLIIEKLMADGVVNDLNSRLSPSEKANNLSLQALLEDKLYFYQVRSIITILLILAKD